VLSNTWRQHLAIISTQFITAKLKCGELSDMVSKTSHWSLKLSADMRATGMNVLAGKEGRDSLHAYRLHLEICGGHYS